MRPDYQSFRRAASVSLVGLAIQFVLTVSMGLYGYFRGGSADGYDQGAITASIFGAVGLLVWLALAIYFDQARRAAIEEMEAKALSDSPSSSVFDEAGDELRVNARRLAGMTKLMLPAVSAAASLIMILAGLFRVGPALRFLDASALRQPGSNDTALVLGAIIAVAGFILARYISGMAKAKVWTPLRGGASFAVGMSLFGAYIAVAHLLRSAGPDVLLRFEPLVFAIGLVGVGAEILLNLLLDLYRPRKAGEAVRPAFDSRLLAFVAAPDRVAESISDAINYQFGFNVSENWFYKLFSHMVLPLILAATVIIWLLTIPVIVEPDQQALVLRNGKVVREVGPGLHYKWPWPVGSIVVPEYDQTVDGVTYRSRSTAAVRTLDLGTPPPRSGGDPILWTTEHTDNERFVLVKSGTESAGSDLALLAAEVPLRYAISDVEAYELLGAPGERDELIQLVGRREVMLTLSRYTLDDILGPDRPEIAAELAQRVQAAFANMNPGPDGTPRGAGIEILFVGLEGVHPPQTTAESFERVVNAQQNRLGRIELARSRAIESLTKVVGSVDLAETIAAEIETWNRLRSRSANDEEVVAQEQRIEDLLAEAGGEAAELIHNASSKRWRRHLGARIDATLYAGQIAGFEANPTVYAAGLRVEALLAAMKNSRVYLTDDNVDLKMRIELQDRESSVDVFTTGSDQ